jgi:sialic acid synthase SpsE
MGLYHHGNMDVARCLVDEAKAAGADIAKFQFFDISQYYGPEFEWYEACMKARLTFEQAAMLKEYCDRAGIEFMASVFNLQGVEWAERLGMKRYKIASRCIYQQDLLEAVVATGKDMIVSLGMWEGEDFPEIRSRGRIDFLYCVSKYPTMPEEVHFEGVDFAKYSGYSDHTIGLDAALIAIARGARIIEKHFTLCRLMHGPDHRMSMEPAELRELVRRARLWGKFLKVRDA